MGLIKGIPVQVREGRKPIEQIRVGDYVLSSHEDGSGTPAYKRVTGVFVHPGKTIRRLMTFGDDPQTRYMLGATGDQRFWVEDVGWTRADELSRDAVLRKADGSKTQLDDQLPVYRTEQPGVGWVQSGRDPLTSRGTRFDYESYRILPGRPRIDDYLPAEVRDSKEPLLKVAVYDVEVEDFHTYYAGYDGVWVHNTGVGRAMPRRAK